LWWPHSHVTGIQRVMLSVLREILVRKPGSPAIRFCQYLDDRGFVEPTRQQIIDCIRRLEPNRLDSPMPAVEPALPATPTLKVLACAVAKSTREIVHRGLSAIYRCVPKAIAVESRELFYAALHWTIAVKRMLVPRRRPPPPAAPLPLFRPCDLLLNIGSGWRQRTYAPALATLKKEIGFAYVVMSYDMIPWKIPGFFPQSTIDLFVEWASVTLATADRLVAISKCSRRDVLGFLRQAGIPEKRVDVVRLGQNRIAEAPPAPPPGFLGELVHHSAGFVLCVGTVEVRKNHRLLIQVWKKLIERHDLSRVPGLVWVGRKGWLIEPLLAEINETERLSGKLVLLNQANDDGLAEDELHQLYSHCLFTMFPSIYEGWGLPVAESLAHGKICIASNAASIPEVAGDLLDYHSPDDLDECLRLTEKAIFDSAYRERKELEIRDRYRPPSWKDCTDDILASCVTAPASPATAVPGAAAVQPIALADA